MTIVSKHGVNDQAEVVSSLCQIRTNKKNQSNQNRRERACEVLVTVQGSKLGMNNRTIEALQFRILKLNMYLHTSKGDFTIREAVPEDLPQLVQVHVTSWNATYPFYHPKPTPELRTHQWQKAFAHREENWFCFLAQKDDGTITGFATGNDFHHHSLPYKGQLNKIHFLKPYQRLGLGRLLVGKLTERFLRNGIDSMILFADPSNPNIRFYENLGGERLLDENAVFQGAYGWMDIKPLLERCRH